MKSNFTDFLYVIKYFLNALPTKSFKGVNTFLVRKTRQKKYHPQKTIISFIYSLAKNAVFSP